MTSRTVTAEQVWPLMGVFGEAVVSKRGAITLGYELRFPVAASLGEDGYDEMTEAFASAIRTLPPWTMVHRQDVYTESAWNAPEGAGAEDFLLDGYVRHFSGRRYLRHRSYLFISFANKYIIEKGGTASGLFGLRPGVSVPSEEEFAAFRAKVSEFLAVVSSGGKVKARPLTDEDWLGSDERPGVIQRVMMLGEDSRLLSDVLFDQDSIEAHGRRAVMFAIGDSDALPTELSNVTRLERYSSEKYTLMMSAGARIGVTLPCEHIVNHYVVVPQQAEIVGRLEKERKKMFAGATNSADNRINSEEVQEYLDDVYKEGLCTVYAHSNIIVWASDGADLQRSAGLVAAAFSGMGVQASRVKYNAPVLYYAALPGNGPDLGRENLMLMELRSSLCLASYETFDSSVRGGNLFLCDRFRHVPLRLDTQLEAAALGFIGNYNQFILGPSGSGKSYYMNHYLHNCYICGDHIFLIDVGDSYEGLAGIIREQSGGADGHYLAWDRDNPISFNPFLGWREWLSQGGGLNTDEPSVNCLLSTLKTLWSPDPDRKGGGWTAETEAVLKQIVVDFLRRWAAEGSEKDPVLDDLYRFIDGEVVSHITFEAEPYDEKDRHRRKADLDRDERENGYFLGSVRITESLFPVTKFVLALKDYASGGSYAFLLNDPAPKDLFSSRFTVFEVDKLSQGEPTFYSIVILQIMNAFERKMRATRGFKNMVVEEAWKAIANETMAPYLVSLWKTARKFNTAAIVVTQEIADILSSPVIKTAIIDNSDTKVLLDQSNNRNHFDAIAELLSLSPKEKDLVMSVNRANDPRYRYREVFLKMGAGFSGVFATELSPEEGVAFESNKERKQAFVTLAATVGYREAIRRILNAKKQKVS